MSGEGKETNGHGAGSEPRNRIEGVSGAAEPVAAARSETYTAPGSPSAPKRHDLLASFFTLPAEERFLAGSALLSLLAFGFARGWTLLFHFGDLGGWFFTFALLGAALTIALLAARRFYPSLLDAASRDRALLFAAVMPCIGLLVELLGNIWGALVIVGALGMGRGAYHLNRKLGLIGGPRADGGRGPELPSDRETRVGRASTGERVQ